METIGSRLKRLRKSKGLTLRNLSKIIDISDTAISKIETGKTSSITISLGLKICKALDVPFPELWETNVVGEKSELMELKAPVPDPPETHSLLAQKYEEQAERIKELQELNELRKNERWLEKRLAEKTLAMARYRLRDAIKDGLPAQYAEIITSLMDEVTYIVGRIPKPE